MCELMAGGTDQILCINPAATGTARSCQSIGRPALARRAAGRLAAGGVSHHVVVYAAGAHRHIAYTNKGQIYGLPFDVAEVLQTIAATRSTWARSIARRWCRHHLGLGADKVAPPACARRYRAGGRAARHAARPALVAPVGVLPAGARAVQTVSGGASTGRAASGCNDAGKPQSSSASTWNLADGPGLHADWLGQADAQRRVGGLRQAGHCSPDLVAVLAYLSRYTHRVAISTATFRSRWTSAVSRSAGRTTGRPRAAGLTHKPYTMTLAPDEFMRRFLLHGCWRLPPHPGTTGCWLTPAGATTSRWSDNCSRWQAGTTSATGDGVVVHLSGRAALPTSCALALRKADADSCGCQSLASVAIRAPPQDYATSASIINASRPTAAGDIALTPRTAVPVFAPSRQNPVTAADHCPLCRAIGSQRTRRP